MSLLLLLGAGASVQSPDRNFTATWEQVAATWSSTMSVPVTEVPFGMKPIERLRPFNQVYARFVQPPATWRAEIDVNDDEITLQELGVL